jgi:NAD(P)-dependent dehydrogenase (short-subunit alcohol dehydrogenase family)
MRRLCIAPHKSFLGGSNLSNPLSGRIALVTGASRGIGRATALALAKSGAHIVAIARTVGGLEELDDEINTAGGSATLVPLDMKDTDGIARLSAALQERYGKLDILVGNAGILGVLSPLSHVEPKVWDDVLAVNVTANWHLIRWMEPLLKLSDAGRAVFVTSALAWYGRAYWAPYASSKSALNAMVQSWAAETVSTNLKVNLISPGLVGTRLLKQAFPGRDSEEFESPDQVAEKIVELCLPSLQETGLLYSYPDRRFLKLGEPTDV